MHNRSEREVGGAARLVKGVGGSTVRVVRLCMMGCTIVRGSSTVRGGGMVGRGRTLSVAEAWRSEVAKLRPKLSLG